VWHVAKALLRGKFMALECLLEKTSKNNNLGFLLRKPENGKQIKSKVKEKKK
jgi:hypothetical protein